MGERCIANECLGTTGFSYTLSLINGKYKMTILYTLMEFGVVRFNEMKKYIGNISYKTLSSTLKELEADQLIPLFLKFPHLILLSVKGPYHSHAGQVLPCNLHNPVQLMLHLPVEGHTDQHNSKDHQREQRNGHHKDKGRLKVNGEGHNHRAKHNKR